MSALFRIGLIRTEQPGQLVERAADTDFAERSILMDVPQEARVSAARSDFVRSIEKCIRRRPEDTTFSDRVALCVARVNRVAVVHIREEWTRGRVSEIR